MTAPAPRIGKFAGDTLPAPKKPTPKKKPVGLINRG